MDEMKELIAQIKELTNTLKTSKDSLKTSTDAKSDQSVSRGDLKIQKYRDYYDVSSTITTALTTPISGELTFDDAGYNRERIFVEKERLGEKVLVANDGADTLFVVVSHGGETSFSHETPIYPHEKKTYFGVYELRLRSPTQGLAYRVTEYPICCVEREILLVGQGSATLEGVLASTESLIIDALDVSNAKILEVQLTCTFNAGATLGATVNLYASIDGTNYDTVANANTVWVTAINNPVSAGNARTKTSNPIDVSGLKKVKIYVVNQDGAQTLTNVTVRYALWK